MSKLLIIWGIAVISLDLSATFFCPIQSSFFTHPSIHNVKPCISATSRIYVFNFFTKYELAPEKGAWFSAFFTVQSDGQFHTHFEYDEQAKFDIEPSKEKYIDDLKTFSREEHLIPQWLKDIVNS